MKTKFISTLLLGFFSFSVALAQEFVEFSDGHVFHISQIKKIRSSWRVFPGSLSEMLKKDESIQLFTQALEETTWMDSLKCYKDMDYTVGSDSIDWTNDALVIPTASEYDNVAYMPNRYLAHTLLVEPDKVYKDKGIKTLEDLKSYAKQVYDVVYPEDAMVTDVTDPRNSLNRFVAYHILPFRAGYYNLTAVDGPNSTLAINWNRRKWDIADWYETCMPYSILKCSYPNGSQAGLYINRRGVQARADERGVFVRGAKVTPTNEMGVVNSSINGIYHYIDDIIAYDQNTQQVVLNERMRIDASALSPDFITSGARGHNTRSSYEGGKYGLWDNTPNHNNKNTCLGFKAGSAENFKFDNNTHIHVRPRTLSFWSYQGDEVTILGNYDVTVKLPPVPAGRYEVRLGTCVEFANRGIVAFYIDNVPSDIVDMRPDGETLFGWKSDTSLGDEEVIANFDRVIHKKGWMKGPKSYYSSSSESGGTQGSCFRYMSRVLRRVIGTFISDGKSDHYLRMQQLLGGISNTMDFDYIEIVPATVYDDDEYVEDRW